MKLIATVETCNSQFFVLEEGAQISIRSCYMRRINILKLPSLSRPRFSLAATLRNCLEDNVYFYRAVGIQKFVKVGQIWGT